MTVTELHDVTTARNLRDLSAEAHGCRRCPLWANATQTVFGEGPNDAKVVIVGEQPGDKEDLAGLPFVGPAGAMLDRALLEAGIDRKQLYVTNAVKHFKNEPRGKRRLHKTPAAGEIDVCRWWLDQEIALIEPQLVVAMGATAARAIMRRATPIGAARGKVTVLPSGPRGLVTVHPSLLLRVPDETAKAAEFRRFVGDLRLILREVPSVAL
jgi:uracil-DNA glycosylase family protein